MKNTAGSLPLPVLQRSVRSPSDSGISQLAYRLTLQAHAQAWADLEPAEMHRKAVEAARDLDESQLWSLTEAHLLLNGLAGAKVSAHTVRAYQRGLDVFLDYARQVGVQLLRPRPNHGLAYVRWLEAQGHSTSTVRLRLAAAKKLFAALRWANATQATPFADVRPAPDPVPRTEKRKPYTDAEIKALVGAGDMEERVIVLLGAHAGLRVSEIVGLLRADVHLEGDSPHLTVTGKRQKRQAVPLSHTLLQALRTWLQATPQIQPRVLNATSSDYVQSSLKTLCKKTGVSYSQRQVHGLRHSAGTRVYTETGDILAVRDHLRHADITSSEIYVEYSRKQKASVVSKW